MQALVSVVACAPDQDVREKASIVMNLQVEKRLCIFRPTQIRYTSLLTYDKSAILHIRPTSK